MLKANTTTGSYKMKITHLDAINEAAQADIPSPKKAIGNLFAMLHIEIRESEFQYSPNQIDAAIRKGMAEAGLPSKDNPTTFCWLSQQFQK